MAYSDYGGLAFKDSELRKDFCDVVLFKEHDPDPHEKHKFDAWFATVFDIFEKNLPDSPERYALGSHKIARALYPALREGLDYALAQQQAVLLERVKETISSRERFFGNPRKEKMVYFNDVIQSVDSLIDKK